MILVVPWYIVYIFFVMNLQINTNCVLSWSEREGHTGLQYCTAIDYMLLPVCKTLQENIYPIPVSGMLTDSGWSTFPNQTIFIIHRTSRQCIYTLTLALACWSVV